MRRFLALSAVLSAASCVDPSALHAFECTADGHCTMLADGGGVVATGGGVGGGAAATGGGAGGGSAMTGGGGGAVACTSSSCTGCCDAAGTCRNGNDATACGELGAACAECGAGARCVAAACEPLTGQGGACISGSDCLSGSCAQGVCCDRACDGACERCDSVGTAGVCSPVPESTQVTACGAYACDGVNGACPTTCTTAQQCAPGHFCGSGACIPFKGSGEACTANVQCSTGFCADGVCCDSACSGSCDVCNDPGAPGTCSPAASGSAGSPACGMGVVCNGSLADCPITCTSGCPSNTYCSGTYCSAKKEQGVACTAATQCLSGFCNDGVCCDSACSGNCDTCAAAQGARADGVCTLQAPTRICRGATSACDRIEYCSGTSATCPNNSFADAGVTCDPPMVPGWGGCGGDGGCGTSGVQSRTRTDYRCTGANADCVGQTSTETQSCPLNTEGFTCGASTHGPWSGCGWTDVCDTTADESRIRTDLRCTSGICAGLQESETRACTPRVTENLSCGATVPGMWSSCAYANAECSETGQRTRPSVEAVCQSGMCGSRTVTETDTAGCVRDRDGMSCGAGGPIPGAWTSCSYASPCALTGTRTRTVTSWACSNGGCISSMATETDPSTFCNRGNPPGACQPTETAPPTNCSYADLCVNTGSGTQSVTTYACNAGACVPSTTQQPATCTRNSDGTTCRPSAGICDRAETCSGGVCPTNTFQPTTYVCEPYSDFDCTNAAYCTGSSATCPTPTRWCPVSRCCGDGTCSLDCSIIP